LLSHLERCSVPCAREPASSKAPRGHTKKTSPALPREWRHANREVRFLQLEGTLANTFVRPFALPNEGSLGDSGSREATPRFQQPRARDIGCP
jgi:hypothetical protein